MTAINAVTDLTVEGDIGVVTLNSPPVNALSAAVREGLSRASSRDRRPGRQGHRADLRGQDLHRRRRHHRVRKGHDRPVAARRAEHDRELAQAGDRRDPRHGAGRRAGSGAGRPLSRRRALGQGRSAGGQYRPTAWRRRHPAACRASSASRRRWRWSPVASMCRPRPRWPWAWSTSWSRKAIFGPAPSPSPRRCWPRKVRSRRSASSTTSSRPPRESPRSSRPSAANAKQVPRLHGPGEQHQGRRGGGEPPFEEG
jgi:hypothetical protein